MLVKICNLKLPVEKPNISGHNGQKYGHELWLDWNRQIRLKSWTILRSSKVFGTKPYKNSKRLKLHIFTKLVKRSFGDLNIQIYRFDYDVELFSDILRPLELSLSEWKNIHGPNIAWRNFLIWTGNRLPITMKFRFSW